MPSRFSANGMERGGRAGWLARAGFADGQQKAANEGSWGPENSSGTPLTFPDSRWIIRVQPDGVCMGQYHPFVAAALGVLVCVSPVSAAEEEMTGQEKKACQ